MRTRIALVALLLSAGVARAADAEPQALVAKAVTATGGAEKLAKAKALTWKGKGMFHGFGQPVAYTGDWTRQAPGQARVAIDTEFMGQKLTFTSVLNGDKGWVSVNGQTQEMDRDRLHEATEQAFVEWVLTLVPLADKSFTLAPLGEKKLDNVLAVGVKVSSKGHRDVNLFFDKQSGMLAGYQARIKDPDAGTEHDQEATYLEFKDFEGIKRATKFTLKRDGKLYLEGETSEYKVHSKLEDSVFAMPK